MFDDARLKFDRLKKVLKRRRKMRDADVVVISHAKSGRTWLATMISNIYHQRYGIAENELIQFDNFHQIDRRAPVVLFSHDNRKDAKQTPLFTVDDLKDTNVILLLRDPRDIAVSAFFQSLRNARKDVRAAHDGDPIFEYVAHYKMPLVIDFLSRWQRQIADLEHSVVVRYEDLRRHPERELARIVSLIEGSVEPGEIEAAVAFAAFDQMKKREASNFYRSDKLKPGDAANPDSYKVRKGKVGGYRDYFEKHQLGEIEELVGRADLEAFGYVSNQVELEESS